MVFLQKREDWDDAEMKRICRSFLDLIQVAMRRENLENLAHPDMWSETLDLIAKIGFELESEDMMQKLSGYART